MAIGLDDAVLEWLLAAAGGRLVSRLGSGKAAEEMLDGGFRRRLCLLVA